MAIPAAFRHFAAVALLAAIYRRAAAVVVLIILASPLSASGFTLTEPGLAPGPLWASSFAIAKNDTRQLAVWLEEGWRPQAALLELDGRLISSRSLRLTETIEHSSFQLFGTGDTFTLIAREIGRTSWFRIDETGRVLEQFRIDLNGNPATDFVWNGQQFGIVLWRDGRRHAQLHGLDGSVTHGPFDLGSRTEQLFLEVAGDTILIASESRLRALTSSGVEEIALKSFDSPIAAIAAGDGWLIASTERVAEGVRRLVTQHVSRSGSSEKSAIAEGRTLRPLAFLETPGGYSLVFDTHESVDSVLLDRSGGLVEGSRSTRLHSRALAFDATAASIAVLTGAHTNGNYRITASQLGPQWMLRSAAVSTTTANQSNPVGAAFAEGALIAFNEMRSLPVIQLVTLRSTRPRLVGSIEGSRIVSSTLPGNGSEALLLHHSGTNLYATRLSPDGTPLDDRPIRISDAAPSPQASASWTGSQWAVAWLDAEDSRAIRFALLEGMHVNERPPVPRYPRTPSYPYAIAGVELHASRSGFVLAWQEQPICSMPCIGLDAIVATLDERGSTQAMTEVDMNSSTPSTATDGEEIVLVEGGRARFIEESEDALVLRSMWRFREWNPQTHVVWDGDEYVAGTAYTLTTPKVAIDRFVDATARTSRRVMERLNPDAAERPTVVTLSTEESLLLVEEIASDGHRIVAYRERDMMPAPPAPPPPVRMRRRVNSGGLVTWEWDAPSSGIVEGYSVEIVYGEWSLVTEILGPDARQYTGTNRIRIRAFNDGGLSPVQTNRRRTVAH